ncbi:MAG TPA: hypothetical protein VF176_03775 [Solirubrobacterales bacterium]
MIDPGAQQTQVLGEHGDPCRGCGAALAADQRYCLNCGRRRGERRIDYREHLSTNGAGAVGEAQTVAPAAAPEKGGRDYAPLAAAGGIAVLGLMLLIGVLIGKGNGAETQAPAPVVRVTGSSAGGSDTTAADDSSGRVNSNAAKSASSKGKGGGSLASGKGGSSAPAVIAGDDDLKALQEQSPEEYQQSSAKLPDTIATPGAPPPVDDKAPGGGSGGGAVIK